MEKVKEYGLEIVQDHTLFWMGIIRKIFAV